MNWWDSINQAIDTGKESITTSYQNLVKSGEQVYAAMTGAITPSQQIASTPTNAQPVAGTNTAESGPALGINNQMLVLMGIALVGTLFFLKKR